jgi:nucleoside phosphorylase
MPRALALLTCALVLALLPAAARADTPATGCTHRVLILSAMPLELNPLISRAAIDPSQTVRIDDRTFYVGKLAGNDVVLAMSGIGIVNATQAARAAFEHFSCSFEAAMFSGVAGSRQNIGDVAIPRRWTSDGAHSWTDADPAMLKVARGLEGTTVPLAQDLPTGDAACLCTGVDAPTPVHLDQKPKVVIGGDGISSDPYGGKAVGCLPGGGDIEGCAPCLLPSGSLQDAAAFAAHAPSLADPAFVESFVEPAAENTAPYDSVDEETAAVAQVSHARGVPFLGVRAVSDGGGDPLHLPGFPYQFFVYRQLAGNNAAAVTLAFLQRWAARPPVHVGVPRRPARRHAKPRHARRHAKPRHARRHKKHSRARAHRAKRSTHSP